MRVLLLILYTVYCQTSYCRAQSSIDTIGSWAGKYHILKNTKLSPDGNWLTVQKWYDSNIDTTMVFDTGAKKFEGNLIGKNTVSFLKNSGLVAFGNGKGEYWNLKKDRKEFYNDVKKAKALSELECYYTLYNNGTLSLFDSDSNKLFSVIGTKGIPVDDDKKTMFAVQFLNGDHKILRYSGSKFKTIYSTENKIIDLSLSKSGKYLFFLEIGLDNKKKVVVLNSSSGQSMANYDTDLISGNMQITEIKEGKGYLITITDRLAPEDKSVVDIWYGNEDDFKGKRYGKTINTYLFWHSSTKKIQKIPSTLYPKVSSINSDRYLLAFNPNKGHNYITYLPDINALLYDLEKQDYIPLALLKGISFGSPEIICSPTGESMLASQDGKRWSFFDLRTLKKTMLNRDNLQFPVFSSDGKYIFFESSNGLWRYDVSINSLKPLKFATGKAVQIVNKEKNTIAEGLNIFVTNVNSKTALLTRIYNKEQNETTYGIWRNNRMEEILAATKDKISAIVYDDSLSRICFIRENYNISPRLCSFSRITKVIDSLSEKSDERIPPIASDQKIVEYFDPDGTKLKGILYYPTRYEPGRKYPMIVHIYQVQSHQSADYIYPSYISNGGGFDIAVLLQLGYFVYLPDIVFNKSGTGMSALQCVDRALDAVKNIEEIDMTKVGLLGESHGGYETNFIATHSSRFAAYISGAGNSDLVRSYFSYNYNFNSPFYWQYENGQYELIEPFSKNKNLYLNNSPILNVEKVNAPILLWAGKKDENIVWDQSMEFYIGLRRNHKTVIALFYPEQGHSLDYSSPAAKDLFKRMLDWWAYFLKDKRDIDWISKQYNH
ncbi:hypothetical protein BAZ12_08650 [Elizabethkingia miricola]|uniref:alpha/beta hydrolase family protein n=1 Tax=Bacteroidota TaxID=976 RepID=UPI0009990B1A|nr:prolyl oligopeptidase family serine peptidase [Elizabethkingia miricola]OPC69884.1 hypothetical protein BAZ12_08650 [Elizabethkingia miricola]